MTGKCLNGGQFCKTGNGTEYCTQQYEFKNCDGTCLQKRSVKCGRRCISNAMKDYYFECDGACNHIQQPCNGKCNRPQDKVCGKICVGINDTEHQEVNGNCLPASVYCNGKCLDHVPYKCKGGCAFLANHMSPGVMTCENKYILPKECLDICVSKKTYQELYQDCNGTCIYNFQPCNGKCNKKFPQLCYNMCIPAGERCYKDLLYAL
jgi:hypothetical protein